MNKTEAKLLDQILLNGFYDIASNRKQEISAANSLIDNGIIELDRQYTSNLYSRIRIAKVFERHGICKPIEEKIEQKQTVSERIVPAEGVVKKRVGRPPNVSAKEKLEENQPVKRGRGRPKKIKA